MRFLATRAHAAIDYLLGAILILSPWLFGYYDSHNVGLETWIPVFLGAATVVYSLMTDYELGAVRVLPMRTHLSFDFAVGVLLAASPWLFGYTERVFWLDIAPGLVLIAASFVTRTIPAGGIARRNIPLPHRRHMGNAA